MIELTQTTQRRSAELGFKLGLSVQVLAFLPLHGHHLTPLPGVGGAS